MSEFEYVALDQVGRKQRGRLDARDIGAASSDLRRKGLVPVKIHESKASSSRWNLEFNRGGQRRTLSWRLAFVRQLATLSSASVPIDKALQLLVLQSQTSADRTACEQLLAAVRRGSSLSAALREIAVGFADDELGLVHAGEQAGDVSRALGDLSSLLERRVKLRSDVLSALVYPAFLMVLAPTAMIVVTFILVPRLGPLFQGREDSMPIMLQVMTLLSDTVTDHSVFVVTALALVASGLLFVTARMNWSSFALSVARRMPGISRISRYSEVARICGTLASLLKGGTSLQSALQYTASATTMPESRRSLLSARDSIQTGTGLAKSLSGVECFDSATLQLIAVGEETNHLEPILHQVSLTKEAEVQRLIARYLTLLTPVLTVVTGLMVGGMVMSVMDAILSANELAVQ